jgi:serine/threonine-protein kinase
MATVYLAHDLKHDRDVAIKVLRPELAAALGSERFLSEIRTTAGLQHPHILPLFDSGSARAAAESPDHPGAEFLYYVMPYVAGESLRDRLRREKQLPLEDALQITREVADALEYAHGHHVIHRDIKPENILLESGHAVVADFGIAKAITEAGGVKLTETGLAVGTPAYMSPEQAAGSQDLDARSDVYSLGCVLYEMLVGEPPYTGPSAQAILARKLSEPLPRISVVRETVPPGVEAALTRALARVPADRFRTAAEFVEALNKPATAVPPAGRARHRPLPVAAAALLLTALAGIGLVVRDRKRTIMPEASVIAVLPFAPIAPDSELTHLGYDLAGVVSASLDGIADLRTVDRLTVLALASGRDRPIDLREGTALGRRLGASSVVYGTLARDGGAVRLDLRLYGSDSGAPLADPIVVAAPADSITVLSDSVTRILLTQIWRRAEPPTPSGEAALRTRSVPALRAFLRGERAMVAAHWREATDAYREAMQADSTFWLAYQRYAYAGGWGGGIVVDSTIRAAYRTHRSELPEADRLFIEAGMAHGLSQQVARFREATLRFPDNWFLWMDLGDTYLHEGSWVGTTRAEAQEALEHAVELNPRLVPAWDHLAWMYLQRRDTAGAVRAYSRLLELRAEPLDLGNWKGADYLLQFRLLLQLARNDGAAPGALMDSVAEDYARHDRAGTLTPDMYGYMPAQIQLELAARRLPGSATGPTAWWYLSSDWAMRGAWDSALVALERSPGTSGIERWLGGPGLMRYRMAVTAAWLGALPANEALRRREAAVAAVRNLPVDRRAEVAWLDGMLAFSQRDTSGFTRARAALSGLRGVDSAWIASLNGFALALRGETDAAGDSLAALEWRRADYPGRSQRSHPGAALAALNRVAAARWLVAAADSVQAIRLLRWFEGYDVWGATSDADWNVGSLALAERARIEEGRGAAADAREDYERFLRTYDRPPPPHRQLVQDAKAALRRLTGLQEEAGAP